MVITSKEVVLNMTVLGRGKYIPMNVPITWKHGKFSRSNNLMRDQGALLLIKNGGYKLPTIREQQQKRMKTRRFHPRNLRPPSAPRNTSSFIMRDKRSGGLAWLVSPVTPVIFSTPVLSPTPCYREGLVDEVYKEWGVDGYGSMNGLIRLRSVDEGERDDWSGKCEIEIDVKQESHAESVHQLEQRIDHGLSRFEIVYPSLSAANGSKQFMEIQMEELETNRRNPVEGNVCIRSNSNSST